MKLVTVILLGILAALQYRLWLGKNSLPDYWQLQKEVAHQRESNEKLARRNALLYADIKNLHAGEDALEERARNEIGLIKKGEVFFRIVPMKPPTPEDSSGD
ncbi:cell division protein FtsB [Idiomarina tyrosinivorans]|uniref:Cell division protein FtsB n=1 Tax=Idiomarina tyrosinivorans TaxID=1445662 RepID=A0A432ZRZ8_9GAMM|nr:cell division protein FtsB [Idiomarina tyrosinivorans]RUO80606.1 cell division protein FtsB [Idiomarina tyrosinivorans]